ncbi:MAG: DUF1992 domain-containing protein [Ectothiorhodospiraceae bacterium]|jgi:hypothetical protein
MHELAESRIREAMERGDFDDLPGKGTRLELDDDPMMPEELRMAYRVLKNANCLPPELVQRREIGRLEELLANVDDPRSREAESARRRLLALRTQTERGRGAPLWLDPAYQRRLMARFDGKT